MDAAQLRSVIVKAFVEDTAAQSARRITNMYNARIALLTRREREVLHYVISGRLNKVTAQDLSISEKTVKVHRARILQKLEVRSVTELTRICTIIGIQPFCGAGGCLSTSTLCALPGFLAPMRSIKSP